MLKALFSSRHWLTACGLATVLIFALLAAVSPQQLPVAAYKTGLVLFAGLVGHWLDRALFPYADPAGYLKDNWKQRPDADGGVDRVDYEICEGYFVPFAVATIRRGIMVGLAVLGMCLGL